MHGARRSSPLRVLHCPTMVGGNPQGLARAERRIGLASWAVAFEQTPFAYPTDETLFSSNDGRVHREVKRWRFLLRALREFDVVHFNFGQSIFPPRYPIFPVTGAVAHGISYKIKAWLDRHIRLVDLALLKRAGKGIIVTYQGDEARQGDYCLRNFDISPAQEVERGYYTRESDDQKRWLIAGMAKYADRIYALNPDLLRVLPKHARFLPYASVDPQAFQRRGNLVGSGTPVVLHAPSHRGVKGTRHVINAVQRLRSDGIDFEFRLVEGLPHAEAVELYHHADLLIDQLLCGWYGGLAVELMALETPVICYLREADLEFIPPEMRTELPVINATPQTLYEVLKRYLTTDRHRLRELGERSRKFVMRWHNPISIARQLKRDYEQIMAVADTTSNMPRSDNAAGPNELQVLRVDENC